MLPTIVLGALPGEPDWAARLARIGIDVAASGADEDTHETLAAARAAAPHLPLKARAVDPGAFDGMRGLIVETPGDAPPSPAPPAGRRARWSEAPGAGSRAP